MSQLIAFLSHPTVPAIGFPALFLLAGVLAKSLADPEGFRGNHLYVGVEASLAATTACAVLMLDLAKVPDAGPAREALAAMQVVSLVLLMACILIRRSWAGKQDKTVHRVLFRGILANGLGLSSISSVVLLSFAAP